MGATISVTWVVCPFSLIPLYDITAGDWALIITCIQLQCILQSSTF